MKTAIQIAAFGVTAVTIVYSLLAPGAGVMWQHPLTPIGVGLIGAGLCLDARKRRLAAAAVSVERR